MKGPDGFVQTYNAQIAVEATSQLIVGQAVTQEVNGHDYAIVGLFLHGRATPSARRPQQDRLRCSGLKVGLSHRANALPNDCGRGRLLSQTLR